MHIFTKNPNRPRRRSHPERCAERCQEVIGEAVSANTYSVLKAVRCKEEIDEHRSCSKHGVKVKE